MAFSSHASGLMWVGAASGLFVSTDGGATFFRQQGAETMGSFERVFEHPTRAGELFARTRTPGSFRRSTDGGASWRSLGVVVFDVDPRAPDLYYGADLLKREWAGLGVSTDSGLTWSPLGSTSDWTYRQLRVDPNDSRVLHGVFDLGNTTTYVRSTDAGVSWSNGPSVSNLVVNEPLVVAKSTPTMVYLQNGQGAFHRSTDGGVSWFSVESIGKGPMAVDPSQPLKVVRAVYDTPPASDRYSMAIQSSSDGGSTWRNRGRAPMRWSNGAWIDPRDGSRVFIGDGACLVASPDGGSTFTEVRDGLFGAPASKAFFVAGREDTIVAQRSDGRLFRSRDGGRGWLEVVDGLPAADGFATATLAVSSAGDDAVFVARGTDLFTSRDAGATWERRGSPSSPTSWTRLDSCGSGESTQLLLYSYLRAGTFYRSTDAGLTWATRYGPGSGSVRDFSFLSCSDADGDRIVLDARTGGNGFSKGAYQSTDGGLSWSALEQLNASPVKITSYPPSFGPSRPSAIFFGSRVSRDGGQSWERWIGNWDESCLVSVGPTDSGRATFVHPTVNGRVDEMGCAEVLGREFLYSRGYSLSQSASGRSLLLATDRGLWKRSDSVFRVVLPAAASIRGVPPTFFHSDVRVVNGDGGSTAHVRAAYRCATTGCSDRFVEFEVLPGHEATFDDVVESVFGAPGTSGAIEFESDEPITVASRLYTPSRPAATFGQFVPGQPAEEARSAMVLPGLSHSADRATGFRSNLGVFNAGQTEEDVKFEVRDRNGARVGTIYRLVAPHRRVQVNDADLFVELGWSRDLPSYYVVVSGSPAARLFADASVVDNQSQDPVFVTGQDYLVPGYCLDDRLVLPAAASIPGVGESFFRSDVSLVNRSSGPADVVLRYDCLRPPCGRETIDIRLEPKAQVSLADVVGDSLGAPGSAGAIVIEGEGVSSVVAASRLYTPSKPAPTFGQYVPGLRPQRSARRSILPFLSYSADAGAGSRTNVGLSNPGDEIARVRLTFFKTDGVPLGAVSRDVPPRGWLQINAESLSVELGGLGTTPDFWAMVESAEGVPVFAYASVVDNLSQDPFFVPAVRFVE